MTTTDYYTMMTNSSELPHLLEIPSLMLPHRNDYDEEKCFNRHFFSGPTIEPSTPNFIEEECKVLGRPKADRSTCVER